MSASVLSLVGFESCQVLRNYTLNCISDMLEAPLWAATSIFQTALKTLAKLWLSRGLWFWKQ